MAHFRGQVILRKRPLGPTAMLALPATGFVGGAGVIAAAASLPSPSLVPLGTAVVVTSAIAAFGALALLYTNILAGRRKVTIYADEKGITENGRLILSHADMVNGYVSRFRGKTFVRLTSRGKVPLADIVVESADQGQEILRALRLDVLHRSFETGGICNVNYMNVPVKVRVGADGVLIRPLGGFVPYDELEGVSIGEDHVVVIDRRDGTPIRVFVQLAGEALCERIREGLEAHRRGEGPQAAEAIVARSGRAIPEWLRGLRALTGDGTYRSQAVPAEELWRVAEDPNAPHDARAGAAVALRSALDDPGRVRLRAAADATAAPRIRVVLETAADDSDDSDEKLERALVELERERSATR